MALDLRVNSLQKVDHGFRERGEGRCILSQVRIREDEGDEPTSRHDNVM